MFTVSTDQIYKFTEDARKRFLLDILSDWFAIWESCYGQPPSFTFESAWHIGYNLLDLLEEYPEPIGEKTGYEFIHLVLTALEQGVPIEHVKTGMSVYLDTLPADDAAAIRFEWLCAPGTTNI